MRPRISGEVRDEHQNTQVLAVDRPWIHDSAGAGDDPEGGFVGTQQGTQGGRPIEEKRRVLCHPIVLGAVYYALGLRNVFFERPIQQSREISSGLVSEFDADPDISPHAQKLVENRNVIQVFYGFVDSNPSLTEKSNNVRANGLVLSSFADAAIISLLAALVYLACWSSPSVLLCTRVWPLCSRSVLSRFLFLPRITKIHLDYSNTSDRLHHYESSAMNSVRHSKESSHQPGRMVCTLERSLQ
jgi:hypothetical protein